MPVKNEINMTVNCMRFGYMNKTEILLCLNTNKWHMARVVQSILFNTNSVFTYRILFVS